MASKPQRKVFIASDAPKKGGRLTLSERFTKLRQQVGANQAAGRANRAAAQVDRQRKERQAAIVARRKISAEVSRGQRGGRRGARNSSVPAGRGRGGRAAVRGGTQRTGTKRNAPQSQNNISSSGRIRGRGGRGGRGRGGGAAAGRGGKATNARPQQQKQNNAQKKARVPGKKPQKKQQAKVEVNPADLDKQLDSYRGVVSAGAPSGSAPTPAFDDEINQILAGV